MIYIPETSTSAKMKYERSINDKVLYNNSYKYFKTPIVDAALK